MSAKRKRIILYSILAVGFLVLAAGLLPVFSKVSFVDPLLNRMFQLKELGEALRLHADYNEGRFPARLDDLVPECLPEGASALKFHDWQTKEASDWIYFGRHSTTDRRDTILVVSPKAFSKADGTRMVGAGAFRLVLSGDCRKVLLTEAALQTCLAEQEQSGWSRPREEVTNTWSFLYETSEGAKVGTTKVGTRQKTNSSKDISRLIEALKKGDRNARDEAADSLGEIGAVDPQIVPALVAALDDRDVGYSAAQALAAISLNDTAVTPALLEVLRLKKQEASLWAVVALEEIGQEDAAAIPLLIEALRSNSSDIRTAAAKAIAGIGPGAWSAVPSLIPRLADGDSWTVKCATIALGRIGPEAREAIRALATQFNDGEHYQIDAARALWKIDPAQSNRVVPALIAELERQQNSNGSNHTMDGDFYSAIELLGEIGPEARAAIPILQANLRGGAWMPAAWALWRIDPAFSDVVTPMLARVLNDNTRPDRLDRLAQGTKFARSVLRPREDIFGRPFGPRLAAAGALWQIHPDKRDALSPVIVALLREWQAAKVLKELSPETRTAIPALEEIEKSPAQPEMRLPARAALRKIATTDYGRWRGVRAQFGCHFGNTPKSLG